MASVRARTWGCLLGAIASVGCGAVEDAASASGGQGGATSAGGSSAGGSSAGGPAGGSSTAGTDGVAGGTAEPGTVTKVPLSQTTLSVFSDTNTGPYFGEIVYSESGMITLVQRMPLALAIGPGYPSLFTAQLGELSWAGDCAFPATVELHQATSVTRAITPTVRGDASVELELHSEANTEIVATGEITPLGPTSCVPQGVHAFELRLTVNAFRPTGALFEVPEACRGASVKRVAPSRSMRESDRYFPHDYNRMFRVLPLDATGKPVLVKNADPAAQMTVRIDGLDTATPATAPTSLDDFVFPDSPGQLTFTPEVGEPLVVEVVEPAQVDRVEVPILFAGNSRVSEPMPDGAVYERTALGSNGLIAPMALATYVGEDALCSAPAEAWFEWESATPEICATAPFAPNDWERAILDGMNIGHGARFIASGSCALTLRAPELAGGAGFVESVSAELRDAP